MIAWHRPHIDETRPSVFSWSRRESRVPSHSMATMREAP
jgi:hypothetical protein